MPPIPTPSCPYELNSLFILRAIHQTDATSASVKYGDYGRSLTNFAMGIRIKECKRRIERLANWGRMIARTRTVWLCLASVGMEARRFMRDIWPRIGSHKRGVPVLAHFFLSIPRSRIRTALTGSYYQETCASFVLKRFLP